MLLSVKTDLLLTVDKDEMIEVIPPCMYHLVKNHYIITYGLKASSISF